ncbi:MAG TPA: methyltransferase domain-containing protein [Dehalococcoidia bacterium]|nr:methyltransferase domain-containing protein [Dehalococcoidia bacterium]
MSAAASPLLVCPLTRQPLRLLPAVALSAGRDAQGALQLLRDGEPLPAAPTERVLLREDGRVAYPVVDGIPLLLGPEAIAVAPAAAGRVPAVATPAAPVLPAGGRYAEAYAEMAHYNAVAAAHRRALAGSAVAASVAPARRASAADRRTFPDPALRWLDLLYDLPAQHRAYRHLAPLAGRRLLQAGGSGVQAVVLLLAGAAEAWLASPMLDELRLANALAESVGVADRLFCVAAIGEELPFMAESFDGAFCPGSLHHMDTAAALPEFARVLRPGGRFAACEPWRAPLYGLGTRLFGKVEPGVHCEVFTAPRLRPLFTAFPGARVEHHGALTRYPLVALQKFGLRPGRRLAWAIARADDGVCSRLPWLARQGSSLALLGTRPAPGLPGHC